MAEAAGLALGVFPVCITLIQSYQQGRSIFRDMRDYRRVLKEFRRELQVEHCKFEQSLYSVFGETMTSDECAEVFKNPEQAEQKLNATLRSPSLVQSFIDSVVAMRNEVESIKEKLEATGVHAGKNADGSAQTCDEQAGIKLGTLTRLRLALLQEEYSNSMTRITKINGDIAHLLGRGQKVVIDQYTPKDEITSIQRHYKRVQNNAKIIFDTLKQKIEAPHGCVADRHGISLCLEERAPGLAKSRLLEDGHDRLSFRILFCASHAVDATVTSVMPENPGSIWRELAIEVESFKTPNTIKEIQSGIGPGTITNKRKPRVAFAEVEEDTHAIQYAKNKPQAFQAYEAYQSPGAGISDGSRPSENASWKLEGGSDTRQGLLTESTTTSNQPTAKRVRKRDKLFSRLSGNRRESESHPLMLHLISSFNKFFATFGKDLQVESRGQAPEVQTISTGIPSQPCDPTPHHTPTPDRHAQSQNSAVDNMSNLESRLISDICQIIQNPQSISERQFLGLLGVGAGNTNPTSQYKVWSMPVGGCFDLEDTLTYQSWVSRPVPLQTLLESTYRPMLTMKDRLSIALKLASSVLQLHHTWWLNKRWSKRDIIFFLDPETNTVLTQTPMVCHDLCSSSQPLQPKSTVLSLGNMPLFMLGLVLWELWCGRCLEESERNITETQAPELVVDYLQWSEEKLVCLAYRAINQMEGAPDDYKKAVQKCLFGGIQANNQAFIGMVWENVVCPLERVCKAFNSHNR